MRVFGTKRGAGISTRRQDYDGAEPAASSVAAMNLGRLGMIFDRADEVSESDLRARSRRCIAAFQSQIGQAPQALPQLLCALELALGTSGHVVLAGNPQSAEFRELVSVLNERLGPRRVVLAVTDDESLRWFAATMPWIAEMKTVGGRATAYVCEDFACQAPVNTPADLRALLARESGGSSRDEHR
jgi:uncharacterized protein